MTREFPTVVFRHCRTTAAGSILIELDSNADAEYIEARWKKEFFGGNEGMEKVEQGKNISIVKNIYLEEDEDDEAVARNIQENYPGAKAELFKTSDGNFMGTMKVKFNGKEQMDKARTERFKLFRSNYYMEPYQPKPKVIKCNRCQRFGHIGRLCRSVKPKCGKCTSEEHETKDCRVEAKDYKCVHCNGNHSTGSKDCEVWKNKEEELARNYNYGK